MVTEDESPSLDSVVGVSFELELSSDREFPPFEAPSDLGSRLGR